MSRGCISVQAGTIDMYCTDMQWVPSASRRQQQGSDVFAVACTDGEALIFLSAIQIFNCGRGLIALVLHRPAGSFRIIARNGRAERTVAAHTGAVVCLRWNAEGALLGLS